MRKAWLVVLALMLLLAPLAEAAGVHAFLDRTHVTLGDTVTLNIQSDGALGTPDLAPLARDFQVLGSSSSSSIAIANGNTTRTQRLGIALKPLHRGTLTIPPLRVGGTTTQPLTLQVGAAPTGGSGKLGDPAFMQAGVASSAPYVGQETVYTVRLFYLPGVSGSLGDPTASGARLIPLDRDHEYLTERDGYTYKVLERSWALIPDRDGSITVTGPAFQGQQSNGGNLGSLLNNPGALLNNPNALLNGQLPGAAASVAAGAPAVTLDARPPPAGGGKPWLPARNVQLQLTGLPAHGEVNAGAPLTLTLSISASGLPASALPEPELPPLPGARVYPNQTQDKTDASGEWLQGTHTRSFAIVPTRNGTLEVPAITLSWWNVAADRAEQATLPAHTLQVTGVVPGASPAPPVSASATASGMPHVVPPPPAPARGAAGAWRAVALASLALWLLALLAAGWWWLRRRGRVRAARGAQSAVDEHAATVKVAKATRGRALHTAALEAARSGDAAACEHALLTWVRGERPALTSLGALRHALADPEQQAALDALQRARWQGGDGAAAGAAIAAAFAHGCVWRANAAAVDRDTAALPPLYPP